MARFAAGWRDLTEAYLRRILPKVRFRELIPGVALLAMCIRMQRGFATRDRPLPQHRDSIAYGRDVE